MSDFLTGILENVKLEIIILDPDVLISKFVLSLVQVIGSESVTLNVYNDVAVVTASLIDVGCVVCNGSGENTGN